MTGMELSFTPSKSCVSRIAREMGIIADMQGADAILTSKNSTLSWDGTSLKGLHLNEVHVTTEDKSVVLGISSLPGGTTEDYTNDILKTVNDLIGNYSSKEGLEKEETTKQAKFSISNTLTDRVAVNHCVVKELEKDFGKSLNELNCNVHPIDGLANKARNTLKEREGRKDIGSKLFGTDCIGTKIVLNVSKLKHKQGVGDPSSFATFLKMSNISPTLLPRYVGNRFNILFKLAGSIFHLRKEMIEYLEKWCASSKLAPALLSDIQSQEGLLQLQALGLFGKLLTGPWMRKIYGEKENIHHLDLRIFFTRVIDSLQSYEENPNIILSTQSDSFGESLELTSVLQSLQESPVDVEELNEIVCALAKGFREVLERQLEPYLHGRLSNPTNEVMEQTKSAPKHNIHSERTLAMADSQCRRAPNAKIDFISSKVRFRMNHAIDWLEKQEDASSVLKFAINKGRQSINKRKAHDEEVESEKIKRMKVKFQKKDSKVRRQIQRKAKEMMTNKSLTIQCMSQLYNNIDNMTKETCYNFIANPNEFTGRVLHHM